MPGEPGWRTTEGEPGRASTIDIKPKADRQIFDDATTYSVLLFVAAMRNIYYPNLIDALRLDEVTSKVFPADTRHIFTSRPAPLARSETFSTQWDRFPLGLDPPKIGEFE